MNDSTKIVTLKIFIKAKRKLKYQIQSKVTKPSEVNLSPESTSHKIHCANRSEPRYIIYSLLPFWYLRNALTCLNLKW